MIINHVMMSRNTSIKSITLVVIILISFIFLAFVILTSHYVSIGDCAVVVYYKPLTAIDRLLFVIIGFIGLLTSIKISKPNMLFIILLIGVYLAFTFILCVLGDELLELRTEYWPHEYHPQPLVY